MSVFKKYKYGRQYSLLLIACFLFFAMTMAIKLTYTAQLVEIVAYYKTTKSLASIGLTSYYFVYTIAQIVLGLTISKINIKNFMLINAVLSCVSFALIGITTDIWQVCVILGLNGVFQCCYRHFIIILNFGILYCPFVLENYLCNYGFFIFFSHNVFDSSRKRN